jgi:sugar phosphate isomerase/epimerase
MTRGQLANSDLALSTSWKRFAPEDIGAVLDAVADLGFRRVELNYLRSGHLPDLEAALEARGLVVPSIHNALPARVDVPLPGMPSGNHHAIADPNEEGRRGAVAWACWTIDWAARLGASAVVLHLGSMPAPIEQRALFDLLRGARSDGRVAEFAAARDRALAEREARKGPFLAAALRSVREIGEHAGRKGVAIGVETRDGYNEIPSLDELDEVFAATAGLPVGYWHDVGHAEKQRLLGIAPHKAYLTRHASRLIGVHLHDSIYDRDHFAPGRGETDLAAYAPLIPEGVLRTLELNSANTREEVRAGANLLLRLGLAGTGASRAVSRRTDSSLRSE